MHIGTTCISDLLLEAYFEIGAGAQKTSSTLSSQSGCFGSLSLIWLHTDYRNIFRPAPLCDTNSRNKVDPILDNNYLLAGILGSMNLEFRVYLHRDATLCRVCTTQNTSIWARNAVQNVLRNLSFRVKVSFRGKYTLATPHQCRPALKDSTVLAPCKAFRVNPSNSFIVFDLLAVHFHVYSLCP